MNGSDVAKVTEEELNAYLDGELDAANVARVEAALADDPQLQMHLAGLEQVDQRLQAALREVDNMPLPEPVLDMIASSKAETETMEEKIAPFPARRKTARHMPYLPLAAAASVVLAVGLGLGSIWMGSDAPRTSEGFYAELGPVAPESPLFVALERTPSAVPIEQDGIAAVAVMTFETAAGETCREFSLANAEASQQGIACRSDSGWDTRFALAGTESAAPDTYVPAGAGGSSTLDSALDALGAGEPLDAEEESARIASGWRE